MKQKTTPSPIYLYQGERSINILLTRLMNADLKQNLHSKLMSHSPTCECTTEDESTHHYILVCPTYTPQRLIMINEVTKYIQADKVYVTTLLTGDPNKKKKTNTQILKAT